MLDNLSIGRYNETMLHEPGTDNRSKILELALELAQTRGFNAFSYRDLATAIGIKTSSIHYYFPTKEDLGRALLQHYTQTVMQKLNAIRQSPLDPLEQFRQFIAIFGTTARSGSRVCLGGMLASDLVTLPPDLKDDVHHFFAQVETWVAQLLEFGRQAGSFAFAGSPALLASVIVAALEGGLITARVFADVDRPEMIGARLESLFVAH